MDKEAFQNRIRGYQDLADRMRAVAASSAPNARNITEGFFLLVCIGSYLFLCVVVFVAVLTLVSVST